jgi:DNA polymerase-3 subunit epsilon
LPDAPGVYRFLRSNGDVLYVGKATSLRKRVASHFAAGQRTTERALEMLSQAHSIDATPTATILEAALLETDEIKRIDPPYNVQLRGGERSAWFASIDWTRAVAAPDAEHTVGPLPSRFSLAGIAAVRALLEGAEATDRLRAAAVESTPRDVPDAATFDRVWQELVRDHLAGAASARTRLLVAGRTIVPHDSPADAPSGWDEARIRRHLERAVVDGVTRIRRARLLGLLAHARIAFREAEVERTLVFEHAEATGESAARPPSRHARLAAFDAHRYDRMRVLSTELQRVAIAGHVRIQVGGHVLRWPLRVGAPARDRRG